MSSSGQIEGSMVSVEAQGFLVEQSLMDLFGLHPQRRQTSWVYQAAKRGVDICGALIGLIVLGLLLPIIALLILLEDRGPIFYKQKRVGKDFKAFNLYKLRTMITDADGHLVRHPELLAAWRQTGKLQNDPRVTRIGSFLRRTSLDELPQLFNVLRGDLSLVGPRPIQFSEIPVFGELIKLRQTVKPGLTGLWQVSGRSNTDYEQRAILDSIYAMDCSFWIDLLIIIHTIPVVLHGRGAY
jgi:exopolysaccharide production protein ExoY